VQPLFGHEGVYVATTAALRAPIVAADLVGEVRVLSEPAKRNTLGAFCWVAANLLAQGKEAATVAMLSADHRIGEPDQFRTCIGAAMDVAEEHGGIVTVGIPPDRPETGYGYIEEDDGEPVLARDGRPVRRSRSFHEKPSVETAREFVAAGSFLWNAGMFFFTLPTFLEELGHAQPDAHACTLEVAEALRRGDEASARTAFEDLPGISVDFAVMERAEKVFTVRADFPWDDVGSWDAMERTFAADEAGNVVLGNAVVIESTGCIVVGEDPKIRIGVLGVEGLVVVATGDAVLVCPKDQSQRVRQIVQNLPQS
jgi:mannose-1-phosphate guanylyltransferase